MRAFSGAAEPLVGEVVGLRTFRVDDAGRLLPLYSSGTWYDGANTACCDPPTGDTPRDAHAVPSPGCECGFYAFGSRAAAAQARQSRYVQAVVSCWGGVVAGSQGFRAEHARIDALWLHPNADRSLRSRVATRYPSARLYADVDTMLAEHPLSELPCYGPPRHRPRRLRALQAGAAAALLTLGVLPYELLARTHGLWESWVALTVAAAALTVWLVVGARGIGHLSAALIAGGVCAWLVAPWFGIYGWLLRLPLLQALLVTAGGALLALRPHHFPVLATPRPRAFRGVLS